VYHGQQLAGVLAAGTGGKLAAWVVDVAELVDTAVARPPVGNDVRAGLDVVGEEAAQGVR
jgi:hypothetical protein